MRALLMVVAVLLPTMGYGQGAPAAPADETYLAIKGGLLAPSGSLGGFPTGPAVEAALGWRVGEHLAVELGAGYLSSTGTFASYPRTSNATLSIVPVTVTVEGVAGSSRYDLFALAGAGVYFAGVPVSVPLAGPSREDRVFLGLHGGAGLAVHLASWASLGAEVRYFIAYDLSASGDRAEGTVAVGFLRLSL